MIITLYKSTADPAELNKTTKITQVMELEGYLRNDCSLLRPRFRVHIVDLTTDSLDFNYVYIPLFKRYYYVREIIACHNGEIEVSCEEDVLMSFKDDIGELEVFIERANVEQNKFLFDRDLPLLDKPTIKRGLSPNNYKEIIKPNATYVTNYYIVFTITNKYSTTTYNDDYSININCSSSLSPLDCPIHAYACLGRSTLNYLLDLIGGTVSNNNILKVVSIKFNLDAIDISKLKNNPKIYIGNQEFDIDVSQQDNIKEIVYNKFIKQEYLNQTIKFRFYKENSLDIYKITSNEIFNPNTLIELFIPYYGFVPIPKTAVSFDSELEEYVINLKFYHSIDIINCNCLFSVSYMFENTPSDPFLTKTINIGTEFPYVTSNREIAEAQRNANALQLISRIIPSVPNKSPQSKSFNPAMEVADYGVGVIGSTLSYLSQELLTFDTTQPVDAKSTITNMVILGYPVIKVTFQKEYINMETFSIFHGSLYRDYGVIKNFSGYLQVGDIHPENIGSASIEEIRAIVTLLQNGIKV